MHVDKKRDGACPEKSFVCVHSYLTQNSLPSLQGFGVKFGGPKTEADAQAKGHGIFISGVKTGSVAEECVEQLRVGWQIIAFNGQDTTKATFVEMKALLASVGNTMELVLQKNDALKAAYSKKKKSKSETQD